MKTKTILDLQEERALLDEQPLEELSGRLMKDTALAINRAAYTGKRDNDRQYKNDTKAFKQIARKLFAGMNKLSDPAKFDTKVKVREDYKEGNLFKVGDVVECSEGSAEIINLGTNYVTLVKEGRTFKKWLTDVKLTEDAQKPLVLFQITEEIQNKFNGILNHPDQYAVMNCIKAYTSLCNITNLKENFQHYKADFDRSVKYFTKFDLDMGLLDEAEDTLLAYAFLNGIYSFNVLNEEKVDDIGNKIDYTIRDMINNCMVGKHPSVARLNKVHATCKKNKIAHQLFLKHLKAIHPTSHEMYKGK